MPIFVTMTATLPAAVSSKHGFNEPSHSYVTPAFVRQIKAAYLNDVLHTRQVYRERICPILRQISPLKTILCSVYNKNNNENTFVKYRRLFFFGGCSMRPNTLTDAAQPVEATGVALRYMG